MKFKDISQFTQAGSYRINMPWCSIEEWITAHNKLSINLSPDYQRDHVWTETQEIRYVEYILRGGRSGREIHFNCYGWHNGTGVLELVDGKQRLKAVRRFLKNEIPAFNTFYKDFEDKLPWMLGPDFVISINELKTRKEVLQWYVDMNSGGTVHTDEEIEKVKMMIAEEK